MYRRISYPREHQLEDDLRQLGMLLPCLPDDERQAVQTRIEALRRELDEVRTSH